MTHGWPPTTGLRRRSLTTAAAAALLGGCQMAPQTRAADGQGHRADAMARQDAARAPHFLARIEDLRQARRIAGLAVVVLRGTHVVLAHGLGLADGANGVAVTPDTLFNIASVSKPISAVVALRLVERGLLDLDRSISEHPGYADFCASARQAGGIFFSDFDCQRQPPTLRQVLAMQVNGTPGSRFLYNPQVFSWASRPIAQAGGLSFSDLVAREVFQPAGMTSSARIHRALALPAPLQARMATAQRVSADDRFEPAAPLRPQGDGAAGGVISSAMDLARFDIALSTGRLLNAASMRSMWAAGRGPAGQVLPYGLGWFVGSTGDGEPLVWHTGLWEQAWSALYLKAPARRLSLILLANSEGLQWQQALDEAELQRSPFARAALETFAA